MTIPMTINEDGSYSCGTPVGSHGRPEAARAGGEIPKALDVCRTVAMSPYEVMDRSELWRDTTVELPDGYDARSRGMIIHAALTGARSAAAPRRALLRMVSRGSSLAPSAASSRR